MGDGEVSIKEVTKLLYGTYFSLIDEDIDRINNAVGDYKLKMRGEKKEPIINSSCSAEGGIVIAYTDLGLPEDFGELLHLRFFHMLPTREELHLAWDRLGIPREERNKTNRPRTYKMTFIPNFYSGWDTFRYNRKVKEAIIMVPRCC